MDFFVHLQENKSDCTSAYGEDVHCGRIDEELIKQKLPANTAKCQALICGTKSFDKDMIKYLRKQQFEGDIFKF